MIYLIQLILGIILHISLAFLFSSGTIHGKTIFINSTSVLEKFTLVLSVLLIQFLIYLGLKKWGRPQKREKLKIAPYDKYLLYMLMIVLGTFIFNSFLATGTWASEFSFNIIFRYMAFIFLAAFFEELVFRGYYFKQLIEKFPKAMWGVIFIQAAFFMQAHIANPDSSFIMMGNIFLIGILLGITAINHFTTVVVFHFLWNFFSGFIFGLPVSGYLFYESLARPKIVYSWEGSVVLFFMLLIPTMVLLFFMLKPVSKKQNSKTSNETTCFKVGVVDFLNAYPLYYGLENLQQVELVRDIPSRLSTLLSEGKLDAGLVSSIEYYKNRDAWDYHPDLCISSSNGVESIRIFYYNRATEKKGDFHTLVEQLLLLQNIVVYYDRASRSSVEILKILLHKELPGSKTSFLEIEPPFKQKIDQLKPGELLLLIGDEALRNREHTSIDLGAWFTETFNQPAVYALWCYPKKHDPQLPAILASGLFQSKKEWKQMLMKAAQKFKFDLKFVKKYLEQNIQHTLDENRSKGLQFFFEEYAAMKKR